MAKSIKKIVIVICLLLLIPMGYGLNFILENGPVGTGYAAKMLCSSVFNSGRNPADIWKEDLTVARNYLVRAKVDREDKSVTATLPGFIRIPRKAIYREGLGCTLVTDTTEEQLRKQGEVDLTPFLLHPLDLPWPKGDVVSLDNLPPNVDTAKLKAALDDAFSEPDPENPRKTRAVVVVYKGNIIAERYAPGYNKDMRLIGWSMSKSVTSALVGILVGQGKLSVDEPAPVPEWKEPGDPRGKITLNQLLQMSSGLQFAEVYEEDPSTDTSRMFFVVSDAAALAANKPLEADPGTKWHYSSGTTNILARIVRHEVGGTDADYFAFPRRELFDKIGMSSAIIEPDPSGTFLGAGFVYANARDWARFGLLFLNDGQWFGQRVLPEGWIKYSTTNAATAPPENPYGAQWWLNTNGGWMPKLPHDLYSARGHEGQDVTVFPSHDLVVVRLGYTIDGSSGWDLQQFLVNVLGAIED